MLRRQNGFTIVELLIVIVVIAILAAITIVAYNGIQQRARNSQTAEAVHAYLNGMAIYQGDNGNYPALSSGVYFACLGDEYPDNSCWKSGSSTYVEDSTLNAAMKDALGSKLPMPGIPPSRNFSGILYVPLISSQLSATYRIDGNNTAWIAYTLDASDTNTKCPVGPVASFNGATFSSTPPASGQTTNGNAVSNATCWIPLK